MTTLKNQLSSLRDRVPILLIVATSVVGCCVLVLAVLIGYNLFFPSERASIPFILIHAPPNGSQLEVGETATIHAVARDRENIVRVEFWVDDDLMEVQTSSLAEGITPFPLLVDWQPLTSGLHTLSIRAFNSQGRRAHASIDVAAIASTDRDGDGVDDAVDTCPDDAGPASIDGCPIPGDADGDSIPDGEDLCPSDPGLEDTEGCPDRDGDGIPDDMDAAPDEPGPAETDGAPDTDGDGIPDDRDLAPEDPGPSDSGGAPETGAGDRDGDGALDDADPCPDDPGLPEDGFCPPPGEDPADTDEPGLFDEPGGVFSDDGVTPVLLEVEAYEFSVSGDYDSVWCYVQLDDGEMERYEFEPQGERYWNIAEVLGGENSVRLTTTLDEPLSVFVDCWASTMYTYIEDSGEGIPEAGGSGAVYDLGSYAFDHGSDDWGGRELIASGAGPGGESFWARYRICSPSCDEAAIQPPILDPITFREGGRDPVMIRWRWDGNEDMIDGFLFSVNGTYYDSYLDIGPDERSLEISSFRPSCGEVLEFSIQVYGQDLITGAPWRSPASNTRIWDGETCPRTVLVTFVAFDTRDLGSRRGPLRGTFFANDQALIAEYRSGPPSFDATDETRRYLDPGEYYSIWALFSNIEAEAWSCIGGAGACTGNYAPSVNYLEVELGPRDTLTFGATIPGAFNASASLPPGHIVPTRYGIQDENGTYLIVAVDVLVGPEAGANPDLVIQEIVVDEESGQPQIRVFNNAADLVDEEVTIHISQMLTETALGTVSSTVTIPSGGSTLIPIGMDIEPYDLRLILDPENTITETEEGELNNIYETPVRMRVEFLEIWGGMVPCEPMGDYNAEFRFRLKVGHRPPGGAVNWVGESRYPWSGTVDFDFDDRWEERWSVAGDPFFIFEFDMPAADDLIIWADGYEDDPGLGADDFAGRITEVYGREMNYGARDENYEEIQSSGYLSCDESTSLRGDADAGFQIWYNITRVH